ncbi:hypothetical protein K450DRAFT_219073 [Umbelopsis ramanniana AG]|uniref:ENTH domain-containing protein n=1 Tax=Umbelopsis ramanniana AG TaxID=1314678 RepID=A0AAD5HIQ4_UMBRA|nr:uncharacterized protein K450DRAFT_219073 [Umbelopsis ramanniana AG]KAI8584279.1 hypothetical protein K450DRAFT_219073 [Umbelopsis ramanniana AG]
METAVRKATRLDYQAPKQKHLQHLISLTHSSNLNMKDLFEMLQRRIRENSWIIVFKALITVHTLMREGSGDKIIVFVEQHPTILDVSRLKEKGGAGEHVRNIREYSAYLEEKVLAYRDLHVDYVKATANGKSGRLRRLPVSQGLLRETSVLQRQIAGLLKCQFSLDQIDNEITLQAFKLLVEDLLVLFQAVNEGVINILEHYFAMSKPDARESLEIYKRFAKQTEAVIDYLSMAKRLQRDLQIEIPIGKHAPLSLATALEEYLLDPDYETQRESAEKGKSAASNGGKDTTTTTTSGPSNGSTSAPSQPKELIDFFTSIENESATLFKDPNSNATFISTQPTGVMSNPTGVMTNSTGLMPNPSFGNPPQLNAVSPQQTGNPFRSSTMPMRSQSTGMSPSTGFGTMGSLQPQMTGLPSPSLSSPNPNNANPFRASTMSFPVSSPYANNSVQAPQNTAFTGMSSPLGPQMTGLQAQTTGMSTLNTPMQSMQGTGMMNLQTQTPMFTGANSMSPRMSFNPYMQQQQQQSFVQSPMNNNVNPFAANMAQQQQMTGQTNNPNNFQQWTPTF